MKIAIFAYTKQGMKTAERIKNIFSADEYICYAPERLAEGCFDALKGNDIYGDRFADSDAMIFVGATGIAVRMIAPYIKSKTTDPAVICVDELARHVVPILSGHIGGANEIAGKLAKALGATAFISTATDINERFSVDSWAAKNGFYISDMAAAKKISAAILESDIPLCSDFHIASGFPGGVYPGIAGELGILISIYDKSPFKETLRLIPKVVTIGIGCRKGIEKEKIKEAVDDFLKKNRIDPHAIRHFASIDLKKDEEGLNAFCRENGYELKFYPAEELAEIKGSCSASDFVFQITGVDNVCERAALTGADRLIEEKTVYSGITLAAAITDIEISFEEEKKRYYG